MITRRCFIIIGGAITNGNNFSQHYSAMDTDPSLSTSLPPASLRLDRSQMEVKLISVTNPRDYEQEMGVLLSKGYVPIGELRLEPFRGEWYIDGANQWQRKEGVRYIREMVKE
jgi:hypothetical protein